MEEKGFLGKGSYGEVWLQHCTTDRLEGRLRAVKEILKAKSLANSIDDTRELEAIAKFSKKEVTCSRSVPRTGPVPDPFQCTHLICPVFGLGSLGKAIPETEARTITVQLLEGLRLMHDEGFAHRDLKPPNIFVTSKGPSWKVKIGDFGVSKQVDQDVTAFCTVIGTPSYLAPEIFGRQKEAAVDGSASAYSRR
ncbi:hypothetical protein CNMCM8694_008423 [Aspergillus lentulus]|nr:hypothetical protein CNMCM8060_009328 [Aspergillus lentulus]KAF4193733.1 hypothetical protein CNMCM8694_008423 [Aspergillus lentulus]